MDDGGKHTLSIVLLDFVVIFVIFLIGFSVGRGRERIVVQGIMRQRERGGEGR